MLRHNSHNIKITLLMCTMYLFLVNIFIKLCNHHHYIISENFHQPPRETLYPLALTLHFPPNFLA